MQNDFNDFNIYDLNNKDEEMNLKMNTLNGENNYSSNDSELENSNYRNDNFAGNVNTNYQSSNYNNLVNSRDNFYTNNIQSNSSVSPYVNATYSDGSYSNSGYNASNDNNNWQYDYSIHSFSNTMKGTNANESTQTQNQIPVNNEVKDRKSTKGTPKRHSYMSQFLTTLIACVICSSLVGGALTVSFSNKIDKQNALIEQITNSKNYSLVGTSYTGETDVSSIVENVSPSVVGIKIDVTVNSTGRRYFFSMPQEATLEGSGIILSKDGYIATNYHVVQYSDPASNLNAAVKMEVHLSDGRVVPAEFVGGDEENDLAVIKVDLNNLPAATLGDSSLSKVGDKAIAIGNPLGLEFAGTVTVGVISGVDRNLDVGNGTTKKLLQTDAAINSGNSGGALVNSKGEVIGINSAKISATGVEGIGFAIPINEAKPILQSLMK